VDECEDNNTGNNSQSTLKKMPT